MYSGYPRRNRLALRAAGLAGWLLVSAGGFAALFFTPVTVESQVGTILAYLWGTVSGLAGLAAAVGVGTNRYRVEWISAWLTAIGLSVYAVVVWSLVLTGSMTRAPQALFISALIAFTLGRVAACAAHATRLRSRAAAIAATGVIDVPG